MRTHAPTSDHQPERPSPNADAARPAGREPSRDTEAEFRVRMEVAFGPEVAGAPIVAGSALPDRLGTRAVTDGRSVHLSRTGLDLSRAATQADVAHELAHVAQQREGRVHPTASLDSGPVNTDPGLEEEADRRATAALRGSPAPGSTASGSPGPPVLQGLDLYTVRVHEDTVIRTAPRAAAPPEQENWVETDARRVLFPGGTDLALIDSRGDWLQVEGESVLMDLYLTGARFGLSRGWIPRASTNLARAGDAATENDRVAQDLDDFLDEHLIPTLARWRAAVRTQGRAYQTAYDHFDQALRDAEVQRQTEADFFAAVLTTVSVGSLGFISELAETGVHLGRLLNPRGQPMDAAGGSLEDALQTGLGEGIDIVQSAWYPRLANTEMHPAHYLSHRLEELDYLESRTTQKVGTTKAEIRRGATAADRAAVLASIYGWWNGSVLEHEPRTTESDEEAMAREMEIGFWIPYIFRHSVAEWDFGQFGGPGHIYDYLPAAFHTAFDRLGVKRAAGIQHWSRGFMGTTRPPPGTGGLPVFPAEQPAWTGTEHGATEEDASRIMTYKGAGSTRRLVAWMRGYRLRTFD